MLLLHPSPEGSPEGRDEKRLRHATRKTRSDLLLGQIPPDENDAAEAWLVGAPVALVIAVQHHVHALEREALRIIDERQDALGAQDVRPLDLHEVLHPREELVRIERLVVRQRNRLHVLIVVVLQAAMRMAMI